MQNSATTGKQALKKKGTAKKHREIILPAEIISKIRSNATTEREALIGLRLAHAIYGRGVMQRFDINDWFDVPCQVLRAVEHRYFNYLYTFKDVIEFNGSWRNLGGNGQCQQARFVIGGYHVTDFEAVPIATTEPQAASDIEHLATAVYKCLSLKIGNDILTEKTAFSRARLIMAKYITATFTADWFMTNGKHIKPINDNESLQLARWVYDSKAKKWWLKKQEINHRAEKMTGEEYKSLCAYHEVTPIRYKRLYVTGAPDLRKFVIEKLKDIHLNAFFVLNSIRVGEYVPRRNDRNRRLDYAFTASGSLLTKLILCNGQSLFCQDLSNSQWTILGRLILNSFEGKTRFADIDTKHFADIVNSFEVTQDIIDFAEHTAQGIVYDKFAEKNGLSRDDAKEAFMFWGFAPNGSTHRFKEALTKTYPSVDAILSAFKAIHKDDDKLPILLQTCESSLYIDCILADCLKHRLEVLTKHDSIYFTEKSRKKAFEIMRKHLDKHLIAYHFKP